MCIGVPMQVISCDALTAVCVHNNSTEQVDLSLVGEQAVGTWLLVFLGAAREVMDAEDACKTLDAIKALQAIASGDHNIDHLFADLLDREPALPEHLREAAVASANHTDSPEDKG
jgi:hydrogenase expression/formation protein HypC